MDDKDFTEQQLKTLRDWANFLQDAKATRRFIKQVSAWCAIIFGILALIKWDQVSAWIGGVIK